MPKRSRPRSAAVAPRASAVRSGPDRSPESKVKASGRRLSDRTIALLLGGLAAALRALFVWSGEDRAFPYSVFYEGDSEVFFLFARSVLEGNLYDNGIPFHPPGFAWLLAGLQFVLGAGTSGAVVPFAAEKVVLGTLVGGGGVALLYLLAAPLFGRATAVVASLLAAFHFGLYVLAIAPVADGLFQLLFLAALALVVRGLELGGRRNPRATVALGLVLGALALTRAEGILYALLVALFGGFMSWRAATASEPLSPLRRLIPWVAVLVVAALVVSPWTIRNAIRLGELQAREGARLAEPLPRFVPVTLYGPLNLALANHSGADGSFSRAALAAGAGVPRLALANPEHLRWILHGDAMARDWIAAHPAEFGRLVLRKWRLYFGALKLGWTQWNLPGGLAGVRRPVDLFVPDRALGGWLLAPLIVVGAWLAARSGQSGRRFVGLVAILTGASLLVVALFFGYARLALLLMPLWLLFAAVALVFAAALVADRLRRRGYAQRRTLARAAAVVLLALLVALEIRSAVRGHRLQASGTTLPGRATLDRDQAIRFQPLPPR